MKESIKKMFRKFSLGPDWMLKREIFVVILFIPAFYVFLMTIFAIGIKNNLQLLEDEIFFLESLLKQKGVKSAVVSKNMVEKDYVEKVLQKISFLSDDRKWLAYLCSEVNQAELFPGVKERLCFLESPKNKLVFEKTETGEEITWKVKNPVEMNSMDIQRILSLVEGKAMKPFYPNPARPNLRFSKINIEGLHKGASGIYRVDFELIQKRK